jgi:hypothetical protein
MTLRLIDRLSPLLVAGWIVTTTSTSLAAPPANPIKTVLDAHPNKFSRAVENAKELRIQVLLSEVVQEKGRPVLKRSSYRLGTEYIYPASALKPAAAVAAFQWLNKMNKKHGSWIDRNTRFKLIPAKGAGRVRYGLSVSKEVRKLLIVSDNNSYNRLYSLVGQENLNKMMWGAGLTNIRLSHWLGRTRTPEENRQTPAVELRSGANKVRLPEHTSSLTLTIRGISGLAIGSAYILDGEPIDEPMDFRDKSRMGVQDLQDMLIMIVRPDIDLDMPGFDLTKAQRKFLIRALRQLPHESTDPIWPIERYDPHRFKPFLKGLERIGSGTRFQVTSKAGRAYGFRIDNAYIKDKRTGRSFFLTASIYTNRNRVLNDNKYEYRFGDRFMVNLAEKLTRHLLKKR